nr:hypothetical protein CFP56_20747 [Quercus suber]
MGKGDVAREQRKTLDIAKVKGKNKIYVDETSVVGLPKEGKKGKETEVRSPLKPKQVTSEEVVVGFLDVGQNEEKKPNGKGSWKKLARAQGPAEGGAATAQKEEEVGKKRPRKIEKQEAEGVRKTKKKCEDASNGDVLMIDEMTMAARQHR